MAELGRSRLVAMGAPNRHTSCLVPSQDSGLPGYRTTGEVVCPSPPGAQASQRETIRAMSPYRWAIFLILSSPLPTTILGAN